MPPKGESMTRDEFNRFRKYHEVADDNEKVPEDAEEVYYEFAAYEDVSYMYSPSTGKIYERRYYVGD